MTKTLLLTLLTLTFTTTNSAAVNKVIYGEDNRLDIYEVLNPMHLDWASSTAGMVSERTLKVDVATNTVTFKSKTLAQRGMCADMKFAQQPTAPSCTGFLVAEDILVTAGHCIRTEWDCKSKKWVFGYAHQSSPSEEIQVSTDDVYGCKEIVERDFSRVSRNDYAVIRLDRKVKGRTPLKFRTEGKVSVDAPLVLIGHPAGLPMKVADSGFVRSNSAPYFFVANTDSFAGNSGSPVLNAETGIVEGILVRGETDFVYNRDKGCREEMKCKMGECRGEDVTKITNISYLKAL